VIYSALQKLIDYSIKKNLIESVDEIVIRNQLIEVLGLSDWQENDTKYTDESIDEILDDIVSYACENGTIPDTANSRELFDTKIMGIVTALPREVIKKFDELYKESPAVATDWYYRYSQDLNYVRAGRIAKNLT